MKNDPFRKLTEEEQRKWDDKLLSIALVSTLMLSFAAAAFVDYTERKIEEENSQNNTEQVIPAENSLNSDHEGAVQDTLVIKPEQFKMK